MRRLLSKHRAQRSGTRASSSTSERVPRCALLSKHRAQHSGPQVFSSRSERVARCALLVLAALVPCFAQTPAQPLARDIARQLIEINTTDSSGDNTKAAEAMAARLRGAGFPKSDVHVLAPAPRKGNLVARLRGTGARRPILLLGHLDVVEARRADWSFDPFQFIERDGFFYGRGTQDIKSGDAALMALLIRYKQEGFQPDRDLILALTADEEGG
ncbi:MAG: M20/M25/M40 family metallo-hydrolase, partial [Bryobacteraceae bacterium]